jgi:hypothetical protein
MSEVISNFFSENLKLMKDMVLSLFAPKQQISKGESGGMSAVISLDQS